MEHFDAVVVGGGPAGSTCAWQLRRAGFTVCVLDRARFPRDKICAGWITPAVVDLLELDIDEYRQDRVFQPITGFRTGFIDEAETETRYTSPMSYGIRRCEFDDYLLRRSGAQLRCGEPLVSLRRRDGDWILNDSISTPALVGAGGHFCPVGRYMNRDRREGPVVATLETEIPLSDRHVESIALCAETPHLHFCADLKGYGWCFRKGRYVNIGLGREDPHNLPGRTREFVASLIARGIVPADLPMRFRGHAYLLSHHSGRQIVGDGVLLAGDAAGLADPHSGEGIRPAVESGFLAAAAIRSANGRYEREALEPYERRLRQRFGFSSANPSLTVPAPTRLVDGFAHRLLNWRWFTRHVVLDRWFLGRHRPALVSS